VNLNCTSSDSIGADAAMDARIATAEQRQQQQVQQLQYARALQVQQLQYARALQVSFCKVSTAYCA
jgi:hypothetical protein